MARKSFVDIPQELVEKIMDSIEPDGATQTLRSLSTVSQHLRPLAHQRLFKSITISTRMPSSNTDDSDVGTSRGRRRRSLAVKLLDALVDAPYLAVYTAQLAIILDDYDDDDSDYTSPTGSSDSNEPGPKKPILSAKQAIPKILHHYLTHNADTSTSKLRKFAIRQSNWSSTGYTIPTGWSMRERVVGVLGLGSLVHVELKNVAIEILRVLAPSVRHVALWNPRVEGEVRKEIEAEMELEVKDKKDKDRTPKSSTVPSGPEKQGSSASSGSSTRLKIQSLLIDDATVVVNSQNTNAVALRWLLSQDDLFDFTKLQKLRVGMTYCDREKGHRQLARLLELCAESLEEFSFSPALSSFTDTDPDAPETPEDPITPVLSTLHSLTFLHIGAQTGFWRPETPNTHDPIPWICTQLSSLPSPLNSSSGTNSNSNSNYSNLKTIIISSSYGMMAVPTLPLPSPGMMMMGPPRTAPCSATVTFKILPTLSSEVKDSEEAK